MSIKHNWPKTTKPLFNAILLPPFPAPARCMALHACRRARQLFPCPSMGGAEWGAGGVAAPSKARAARRRTVGERSGGGAKREGEGESCPSWAISPKKTHLKGLVQISHQTLISPWCLANQDLLGLKSRHKPLDQGNQTGESKNVHHYKLYVWKQQSDTKAVTHFVPRMLWPAK